MTKKEMIEYIRNADKKDGRIKILMKKRNVKECNERMLKADIIKEYNKVIKIEVELGLIKTLEIKLMSKEQQKLMRKIQIMLYGKKEFECDKSQYNLNKKALISQELSKRYQRILTIKSLVSGKKYTICTRNYLRNNSICKITDDKKYNFDYSYFELKVGDRLARFKLYTNDCYNYEIYESIDGSCCLCSVANRAWYTELYEVVKIEDKEQNYCVYQITNNINDKVYYGITNNFKKRKYDHFNEQREEKLLYNHMKKIGNEHFKMEVLYDNIQNKRIAEKIETILIMTNKNNLNSSLSYNGFNGKLNVHALIYYELMDMGLSEIRNIGFYGWKYYDRNKVVLDKEY